VLGPAVVYIAAVSIYIGLLRSPPPSLSLTSARASLRIRRSRSAQWENARSPDSTRCAPGERARASKLHHSAESLRAPGRHRRFRVRTADAADCLCAR